MIRPKALKKGDTVGLIAPSGRVPAERVPLAVKALEKRGLSLLIGESCMAKHGYLAGDDALRAADINRMFADDRVDAVFAIRGGYGAQRLLPLLDYDAIRRRPKIFAGYSDATALHIALNQRCGLITYHAPMPGTELYKDELDVYTNSSYMKNLFDGDLVGKIENPPGEILKTLCPGAAKGQFIGGNLSLLAASLGTPYEIDTKGKLLFIEEIGEEPYRVDRMLT
ncbi:MAG: LD-carboxypeptidase, partial [Clostridiales bacterium]|nr:LD-carboxypeptidase [Clostridiales bacterium]